MQFLKYIPEVGEWVEIPTSTLGKIYGKGQVVAKWKGTIQVKFGDELGQYTLTKHDILPLKVGKVMGMDIYIDTAIPIDEIHIKDKK